MGSTYLLATQRRGPLPNATFHLSSRFPESPSQRSGLKVKGSSKIFALSCMVRVLIETVVLKQHQFFLS
jgi:hypothetical protein